jgi:hypothetical protein
MYIYYKYNDMLLNEESIDAATDGCGFVHRENIRIRSTNDEPLDHEY